MLGSGVHRGDIDLCYHLSQMTAAPPSAPKVPEAPKPHSRRRERGASTHVINQVLRPSPSDLSSVETRLDSGRRVYNACLAESFARCKSMKADPAFDAAKALPRGKPRTKAAAARRKAFDELANAHGFTKGSIQSYGSSLRKEWVREHVGAQEAQSLAARAFGAVDRWSKKLGGKPRYKSFRRGLRSMECKDRCGDISPDLVDGRLAGVTWAKRKIAVAAIPESPTSRADREASAERARLEAIIADGRLLYVRIVRNTVRGKPTLRAQFVVDGRPPVRHETGTGTVSFDVGPSVMSVVVADAGGDPVPEAIGHYVLAEGIDNHLAELRRLQRHLDRQHRAGSPGCFDDKGRHKKVCEWWEHRSKSAQRTIAAIAEVHRRTAAHRTTMRGKLVNELLAFGANVRAEDLNYAAWQKMYPRSVRDRAVGEVVALLFRKAENAGGQAYPYATWSTALSQTCVCGHREKKPLSQRWHRCPKCKRVAQRDLFSAFLGLHVSSVAGDDGTSKDLLDLEGASASIEAFAPHLQEAGGLPRSSSATPKRRGQGRRSRRSMARIAARHHRASSGTTETLGTSPEAPDTVQANTSLAAGDLAA